MFIEEIQDIIDDKKLEVWTVSKIAGEPKIMHNQPEFINSIIGLILREMKPELRYELISDALIHNEVELSPSICNSLIDNTSFHDQYIGYLVECVLWYLFNNDDYVTSPQFEDEEKIEGDEKCQHGLHGL